MSTNVKIRVHIRWLIRRDNLEVIDISNQSMPVPYTEEHLISELRRRNCIGMVAEHGDKVVGFMIEKREIHLEEIAVHQDFRSLGVGEQMIAKIVGKLSNHRRTKITLHCRESNLRAQQFYRSQGFIATSVLRDYYNDDNDDAYCFEYRLPGTESK